LLQRLEVDHLPDYSLEYSFILPELRYARVTNEYHPSFVTALSVGSPLLELVEVDLDVSEDGPEGGDPSHFFSKIRHWRSVGYELLQYALDFPSFRPSTIQFDARGASANEISALFRKIEGLQGTVEKMTIQHSRTWDLSAMPPRNLDAVEFLDLSFPTPGPSPEEITAGALSFKGDLEIKTRHNWTIENVPHGTAVLDLLRNRPNTRIAMYTSDDRFASTDFKTRICDIRQLYAEEVDTESRRGLGTVLRAGEMLAEIRKKGKQDRHIWLTAEELDVEIASDFGTVRPPLRLDPGRATRLPRQRFGY